MTKNGLNFGLVKTIVTHYNFIRFGIKLHRQIVGISMDTNCAPRMCLNFVMIIESTFQREGSPYLALLVMILMIKNGLKCCLVKTHVTFWITFSLDLALSYTDKLWEFRRVLIVFLL